MSSSDGDGFNARTYISGAAPSGASGDLLADGYALVAAEMRTRLERGDEVFVLALAHPSSGEARVVASPVLEDEPLTPVVVGRHEHADLALSDDAALSLRHAIVLLGRGPEGGPLARVLDLRSGTGMSDATGLPHFSVAADGPLALRVGDCALFLLPWNVSPEALVPGTEGFGEVGWPALEPWLPVDPPEQHITQVTQRRGTSSVVTMLPQGTGVGKPLPRIKGDRRAGLIRLEGGGDSGELEVGVVSLRAGVFVGRYPRCDLSYVDMDMPETVSRVHALFLLVDERVHVFDTGSTHGLTFHDFPVRGLALPEHQPSALDIKGYATLSWFPS